MANQLDKAASGLASLRRWPTILGIATLVAFVGSMLVFNIKPWGPWVVIALLAGWTLLIALSSATQDRRDRAAGRVPDLALQKPSKFARGLQVAFFLSYLGCSAYGLWLRHQGARDLSRLYLDTALALLLLSWVVGVTTEAVISWLARRRSRSSEPR